MIRIFSFLQNTGPTVLTNTPTWHRGSCGKLAIELQNEPFSKERVNRLKAQAVEMMNTDLLTTEYYVFTNSISNLAYTPHSPEVKILLKSGKTADISDVSDMFDHRFLSERITKYFLCYPKEFR